MTLEYLLDPRILGMIGVAALLITDLILWHFYPEKHKRTWKAVKNFFSKAKHLVLMLIAFTSASALALVAVYFYYPEMVEAMRTSSPELYAWACQYVLTVIVGFLILTTIESMMLAIGHYGDRLDDGIINDIDAERRFQRTDTIIGQMELDRRRDSAQRDKEIQELKQLVLEQNKALYRLGTRYEENPTPPEGEQDRRKFSRQNPAIPLTEKELDTEILPALLPVDTDSNVEETVPAESEVVKPVPPTNVSETEADVSKTEEVVKKKDKPIRKWFRPKDWDAILWGEDVHTPK